MKPDLVNATPESISNFARAVIGLAAEDHRTGHRRRSGKELVDICASDCRIGHHRMATGIYNQTRWSLECADVD